MKTCIKCHKLKENSNFYWKIKDVQISTICKLCTIALVKEKALSNEYKDKHKFKNKMEQAKRRGIHFDVSLSEFSKIRNSTNCYYCNTELNKMKYTTIDRINPLKGYVSKNIVASCQRCNRLKSSFDTTHIPYLQKILRALKKAQ